MQLLLLCSHFLCHFKRDVLDELHQGCPVLKGDKYGVWHKKVDLAFVCAEVDWVLTEPQPIEPSAPVRAKMTVMLHGRKWRWIMLLYRWHMTLRTESG